MESLEKFSRPKSPSNLVKNGLNSYCMIPNKHSTLNCHVHLESIDWSFYYYFFVLCVDGKMRGFAFVLFKNVSEAARALNALNLKEIKG